LQVPIDGKTGASVVGFVERPATNSTDPMHSSNLYSFAKLVACAAVGLATLLPASAADAAKVDPSGKWTWTMPGRNGGPDRTTTLTLKVEGEKVTGKVASPGREWNGNKFVSKYNGKVSADAIKGKIESERNGETMSRDWEAKREAAKKDEAAK
jgi:hypothetical protein